MSDQQDSQSNQASDNKATKKKKVKKKALFVLKPFYLLFYLSYSFTSISLSFLILT